MQVLAISMLGASTPQVIYPMTSYQYVGYPGSTLHTSFLGAHLTLTFLWLVCIQSATLGGS